MKILLVYGSTEGQTRKIADFCLARLSDAGHDVDIRDSRRATPPDISAFDAVILAGSVHEKRHQQSLERYVFAHRAVLTQIPSLLLSVSLSIAFENGEQEAQDYVSTFSEQAQFEPNQVALVAGALKRGQYDYYMNQIVDFVVLKDQETLQEEQEFTDWDKLGETLDAFVRAT